MKNMTQKEWVKKMLKENGYITRNQALRNYISRLGAIVADLKAEGLHLEGSYIKVETPFGIGKDYRYDITNPGVLNV